MLESIRKIVMTKIGVKRAWGKNWPTNIAHKALEKLYNDIGKVT